MISRFSLRLLTRLNRRLITNQAKVAFFLPNKYSTYIASDRTKHNLKPGYNFQKYSTILHETRTVDENDVLEEEEEEEKDLYGMKYYASYIQKNPDYHESWFNIERIRQETKNSNRELFLAMKDLLKDESNINEEMVIKFQEKLKAECSWLTYYELVETIHNLLESEILKTNFTEHLIEMLTVLDWDCYNRVNENTVDENLWLAQVWLKSINIVGFPDRFLYKCKMKHMYKIKSMSKAQLIITFYIILESKKKFPYIANPYFIAEYFQEAVENLTVNEIALISRTFYFKKKNYFTPRCCVYILQRLSEEMKNCSETVVKDALQGINYCLSYSVHQPAVKQFQQSVADSADRFSLLVLNSALTLGCGRNACNEDLLNTTFNRLKNDVENCRVQMINRYFNTISAFNINHPEFFELVQNYLRKEFDSQNPIQVVFNLYNLALFEVYPEDLIARLLADEFQETLKKKGIELPRKFSAFIDLSLDIEKADYNGPRMNEKRRYKLLKAARFSANSCPKFENGKWTYMLEDLLKKLGDSDQVAWKIVLPHFGRPNVIVKLDKNLKYQQLPDVYWDIKGCTDLVKPTDTDNYNYLAFRIIKRQSMGYDNEINATEKCFNRHLTKMGYIPVTVQLRELAEKNIDESHRLKILENRIKEAVENIEK